ncbi:accessory factor UbiK family protein [Shewanella sp. WXL01]|uniref:Ubiquinone biosynthesis accessory factor UbiK n=1 Tax=Shewanella maritima TaxID=2520507 RepID=A0A411PJD6_9GAMM|nr:MULTISPECIES: accessory factor UbiK family protein [Shewanella]NKF52236.1 accessory factor UbiK family protein [Shewanella sp. WXL01]QBF83490.1 accessory factor UbiK family protein [Shewanella maritima]
MINPKKIEEVAKQLSDNLPNGVKQFAGEFEEKSKQIIQSQLMKLDVVSREEFEVQQHVLLKTREKLEALQTQVSALEAMLAEKNTENGNQPDSAE